MRILIVAFLILVMACQKKQYETTATNLPTRVSWQLISNTSKTSPSALAAFTFFNDSDSPIAHPDFELFFSQTPRHLLDNPSKMATVEQMIGDFYRLQPDSSFYLAPGDSLVIPYEMAAWLIKESDAPSGLYWSIGEEQQAVENYTVLPFETEAQLSRHRNDKTPMVTPEWQYEANEYLSVLDEMELLPIIPTPQNVTLLGGNTTFDSNWQILATEDVQNEANYLNQKIKELTQINIPIQQNSNTRTIELSFDKNIVEEGYHLQISETNISITGKDAAGVFYGIQSLLNLLPANANETIKLPLIEVKDAPRFAYRGMHLDVARNFQSVGAVKKLITAMAYYKLNKLHLHLTDDEGWRLEIEDLPELTDLGAQRGHDLESQTKLSPSYGSGYDNKNTGSGYYTRDQYKAILRYARQHHIEVIPEINMPGHARAAIKSMEARYRKYKANGDEKSAEEYLLSDSEDASEYLSVQDFPDNVVCVCCEAVYHFYEKVVDEVIQLHNEADAPLRMIHTGGDEVPNNVWTASPMCKDLMKTNSELNNAVDLSTYFMTRLEQILSERNLSTAGWEEIAMKKVAKEDGSSTYIPHPKFTEKQVIPYVWQNLWGNQDLGYRLANAGYSIVLCNVTNLYFDLAYNKDPKEPGLYWGGFVDTRKPYELIPYDVFKSTKNDPLGDTFDEQRDYADMERLEAEAQNRILGIQAALWSETIKTDEMLEYYYLPKLMGLAERAWATQPEWATIENSDLRERAIDKDWNRFANTLAQRELPKWTLLSNGYNYRLPPPGLRIEEGKLYANSSLPGLIIRYTTDGSQPTIQSPLYEKPTAIDSQINAKTFDVNGRSSRTATVKK